MSENKTNNINEKQKLAQRLDKSINRGLQPRSGGNVPKPPEFTPQSANKKTQ